MLLPKRSWTVDENCELCGSQEDANATINLTRKLLKPAIQELRTALSQAKDEFNSKPKGLKNVDINEDNEGGGLFWPAVDRLGSCYFGELLHAHHIEFKVNQDGAQEVVVIELTNGKFRGSEYFKRTACGSECSVMQVRFNK